MGITDRRYMTESGSTFGSFRGYAINAVGLLVLINVAVWLVWQFAPSSDALRDAMSAHFWVRPSGLTQHYYIHTLLTSAFSHSEFYHILFNMLVFWYLGKDLEVFYGRNNTVVLYVFAGIMSALAHCGLDWARGVDSPALGASGAIMGIAVAAAFIDPLKPMQIFGLIPVPLWLLATLYCVGDLTGVINSSGHFGDRIGHAAHLGGAFAGLLFYTFDLRVFASRGRKNSGIVARVKNWWRGRQFQIVERRGDTGRSATSGTSGTEGTGDTLPDEAELVAARRARGPRAISRVLKTAAEPTRIDPETARRVDELLAKISRDGIGGLSAEEREFLKQSSEKYRK